MIPLGFLNKIGIFSIKQVRLGLALVFLLLSVVFLFSNMATDKTPIYLQNMQRSIVEVYTQIEKLMALLPDDMDEEDLTPDQWDIVHAVNAMESEWILDKDVRASMSCIQWTDD